MRSLSAAAAWVTVQWLRAATSSPPVHARPRVALRCLVVPIDLLPLCALQLCCLGAPDHRTLLVERQDARVVHNVLVHLPELESQLPRSLLDGCVRPYQEMPVAACEMSALAILVPGRGVVIIGVVADHQEFGGRAPTVQVALQLLQPVHGHRTDSVTGRVSHGQYDGMALQNPQIEELTAIVTPRGRQLGQPSCGGVGRCWPYTRQCHDEE